MLTFTPYYHWRWEHAIHHGTSGHLDKRGTGDVWTMTVQEYLDVVALEALRLPAGAQSRRAVRASRRSFVFLILQRFPSPKASRRERHSVAWMNLALLCVVGGDELALWRRLLIC